MKFHTVIQQRVRTRDLAPYVLLEKPESSVPDIQQELSLSARRPLSAKKIKTFSSRLPGSHHVSLGTGLLADFTAFAIRSPSRNPPTCAHQATPPVVELPPEFSEPIPLRN